MDGEYATLDGSRILKFHINIQLIRLFELVKFTDSDGLFFTEKSVIFPLPPS